MRRQGALFDLPVMVVDGTTATITVIGDTVNVASRIEVATKAQGVNLLVSAAVFGFLADRPAVRRRAAERSGRGGLRSPR